MSTPEQNNLAGSRIQQVAHQFRLWIFAISLTLLFTLVFSFNLVLGSTISVALGEPAEQDILAPYSTSYVSEVNTKKAQDQAMATVPDIYTGTDLSVLRTQINQTQALFNYIDVVRADVLADELTKIRYLVAIEVLPMPEEIATQIIGFSNTEWNTVKADVLNIVDDVLRNEIRDNPASLEAARSSVRTRVSINLSPQQEAVVTYLASDLIVPNSFFDEAATNARREEVADAVEPQRVTITQGQRIVRVGEIVTAEHMEMLSKLGLLQPQVSWPEVGRLFTASLLAVSLITLYWQRFWLLRPDATQYLFVLGVLLFIFVLVAKLMVLPRGQIIFLFPAAALAMLLTTIFDVRFSLFTTVVIAGLLGYTNQQSLEIAVYCAVGPLFAVLTLRDAGRIIAFFRAGMLAALTNMVVVLIFRYFQYTETVELIQLLAFGLVNGLLISTGVTLGGFYIAGGLFGTLTILQLQELSRLDHPLLKELLRRAPGTYHHSIMVANLAEQAAERIQANSTLVRVGAFYHDIGKMNRPPFFTENQEGVNPHDALSPQVSARIIISHVSDGLEMARKYRLPNRIQDFIAEHHGNRLVYVFYMNALEQAGGNEEAVDKSRFRYRGPRPRSRETGIVALADSVDAAATALRPNTEEEIVRLVNKLVDDHLKDGQLDNSGLTLGDIKQLKASFVETLKGRFHVRVRYPGNEELMEEPAALPAPRPEITAGTQASASVSLASARPAVTPAPAAPGEPT